MFQIGTELLQHNAYSAGVKYRFEVFAPYTPREFVRYVQYSTSRRHLCVHQLTAQLVTRSPGQVAVSTSKKL